jgi:leucine dehydrogenase
MNRTDGAGFLDVLEGWDGLGVFVRRDRPTGTWIFIALHDDSLGPATGGCRMKIYDRPEDGLRDALRLAEGMTYKWAAMDFPFGGGKTVLAIPRPIEGAERRALFLRFGALLQSLGGRYGTGADLGTTTEDMLTIAEVSPYVIGVHGRSEGPMDPSPFTALGVFEGIRSALRHRFGTDRLEGRRVLVQGVGAVGASLAERLGSAGADVVVSDVDEARAARVAARVGGSAVAPATVYDHEVDVYAPCAVGATLSAETIPRLRCAIVAGAANNQLRQLADADRLHDRGILYAPDYVINGGGAMAFTLIYQGIEDLGEVERRVRGIGERLTSIFAEADAAAVAPAIAARQHAESVLRRGPLRPGPSSFEDAK